MQTDASSLHRDVQAHKKALSVAIGVIMLLVGIIFGYGLAIQQIKEGPIKQVAPVEVPIAPNQYDEIPPVKIERPEPPAVTDTPPITTETRGGKCTNQALGVEFTIPDDWICKIEGMATNDPYSTTMSISSDLFTIRITSDGPYCYEDAFEQEREVANSYWGTYPFLSNKKVRLIIETTCGEDQSIMGHVIPLNPTEGATRACMFIQYKNMQKQKLTADQKNELLGVLDTITPLK